MASEKLRQRLRAKLGIPRPQLNQASKSAAIPQIQPARKGCCGKKV